jgi:NADP-dependent 3-hydroxy acid dehydrogenase YdfG
MSGRRVAIVTGASSGIGAAIGQALATSGFAVALGARRMDRLGAMAEIVEGQGGRAVALPLDVTRPESIDAFVADAEARLGPVEVVVSNAGIGVPGLLHEVEAADLEMELRTNLLGPMLLARRVLPAMLARKSGDLVFVSSMNAVEPRPFQAGYTAAKAGVEGLARALRRELEGTGVRAVVVRPGPTRSEFGFAWGPEVLERVLDSWKHWGFLRHNEMLDGEAIAKAVVWAVSQPRSTSIDVIQVNPEG